MRLTFSSPRPTPASMRESCHSFSASAESRFQRRLDVAGARRALGSRARDQPLRLGERARSGPQLVCAVAAAKARSASSAARRRSMSGLPPPRSAAIRPADRDIEWGKVMTAALAMSPLSRSTFCMAPRTMSQMARMLSGTRPASDQSIARAPPDRLPTSFGRFCYVIVSRSCCSVSEKRR